MALAGALRRGACTISQSQRADAAELHLLFAKGKRPDRAGLGAFAAQVMTVGLSHSSLLDAQAEGEAGWPGQLIWAELLRDGLTFDLSGLAPGSANGFPAIEHRFDLPGIPTPADFDAIAVLPGPHLASSAHSLPVSRGMLALACELIRHFEELAAISWAPSRSAIGRRFFESVTTAWLEGGAFPALGLTAFVEVPDCALQSVGLGYWIGQELRIEPPLSADRVAATRLGIRLVNQLVLAGRVEADERIIASDGTRLVLRPSRDRASISVWRE